MKVILHFSITFGACQNIPRSDLAWEMVSFFQFITFAKTVALPLDTTWFFGFVLGNFKKTKGNPLGFFGFFSTDFSKKNHKNSEKIKGY